MSADFHSLEVSTEASRTSVVLSHETGCFEDNGSGLHSENTKNICAWITAKLQAVLQYLSSIGDSLVSTIVGDLEVLAAGLHSQVKHEILSVVPQDNPLRSTVEESLKTHLLPLILKLKELNTSTISRGLWSQLK